MALQQERTLDPERTLKDEMQRGLMPQALLITGPYGVGKKTLARSLAKGIMCHGSGGTRPCGICKNCRRFDRMQLPDLLMPENKKGTKSIGVDAIRNILSALGSHPLENGKRVVLIENAEQMTPQAQNALLKSIEEPEESTHFLFTADSLRAILPTIRSRSRIVRIPPWPADRMAEALQKHGIPYARCQELIPLASGSVGRALEMESDAHFWECMETVKNTFLSVRRPSDIPARLKILKDRRDDAAVLLNILEMETELCLRLGDSPLPPGVPEEWGEADEDSLRRILEAVVQTRMYRGSNVQWTSAAERLMQIISEETALWST